jgi:uncharacterized protein
VRDVVPVTDEVLREMASAIVEAANPERVILFGSRSRSDAQPGSDVDLLVVENEPFSDLRRRGTELRRLRRALSRFRVAKDIVVVSKEEFDFWRQTRNHVVGEAALRGRVLYARP